MNSREQATRLEISTIQPIPLDARHGRAKRAWSRQDAAIAPSAQERASA
jgi:hypothetical protein